MEDFDNAKTRNPKECVVTNLNSYLTYISDIKETINHACKVVTKKSRPKWTALIISVILRGRRAAAWGTAAARSY